MANACRLVKQLGPQNGEALERAFGLFHEYGLVFDFYKRNISLLVSISEAKRYLSLSLADMLGLSVEISLLYRKNSRGMATTSVVVDFNLTFGGRMESFVGHKDRIAELMWTWQLENSSEISGTFFYLTPWEERSGSRSRLERRLEVAIAASGLVSGASPSHPPSCSTLVPRLTPASHLLGPSLQRSPPRSHALPDSSHCAHTHFANNLPPPTPDISVSIESIRQWLLPQDRMLQALVTGRRATRTPRAEFTCEWLDRPLVDFARSRDKVLTITAEAGAGKSYLFGWILERLQRRVGHHEYQAIQATVDSQVPAQATQIALVKSLLLQLLEQNVGNVTLFRCLANVTELGTNTSSTEDAEDALWYTLDTALQGLQNVVLVIDGLDSLEGDDDAKIHAFEHLYDIATKNKHNVRVIILTRPLSKPWPKPTRQILMTPQRTTVDVKRK